MKNFNEKISKRARKFDKVIAEYFEDYISKSHGENKKYYEAISYTLLSEGKRLRPILLLKTYKIFGGKDKDLAEAFAIAIECIHNYSLVHDDLPEMDNDDYRRGRPTNHKVYGQGMALLVGDGLLNLAYEIMLRESALSKNKNALLAIYEIAYNSGINGMIGGQVMESLCEDQQRQSFDAKLNLKINLLKTACLFRSSIVAGAMLAGIEDEKLIILKEYAELVGIAFQIKDDIMDSEFIKLNEIEGDYSKEEKSYILAKSYVEKAKETIHQLHLETKFYDNLADFMIDRSK